MESGAYFCSECYDKNFTAESGKIETVDQKKKKLKGKQRLNLVIQGGCMMKAV